MPGLLVGAVLILVGCGKQADQLAQGWSPPIRITDTKDSLVGGVLLYKRHNALFALQPQDNMSAKCFLLNSNDSSWTEVPLSGVPSGYFWYRPGMDEDSDRVCFEKSYLENDQLVMPVLVGQMTASGGLAVREVTERQWLTDTKSLFGTTRPNVTLSEPGRRVWPGLGISIINGQDLYYPYCLSGLEVTYSGKQLRTDGSKGPFNNGVFHSTDSGTTWQMERISELQAWSPSVCKSKGYYHYFAVTMVANQGDQLWFTRKPVAGNSWGAPITVTKTYGSGYIAVPQDDLVHLCWLDRRHEKRRLNLTYPDRHNFEVAYRQRKDSDANWSHDVILSEGLLYAFSPSMSVEGDKVVVAWAGVKTAKDWHAPSFPNDIYYATSADKGKTWTKPLRVTDNIKAGITAGEPKVVLLNGVIHLCYIQGKLNLKQESPGLTKLNQPPWPNYYQQRPFPL